MIKISFSALYIINQIKFRRLILGISARQLSIKLSLVPTYIGKIESLNQDFKYTVEMLVKVAEILGCTVQDFYPPDEMLLRLDSDQVFKEVISLSKESDAITVIRGLIKNNYFKVNISLSELGEHLHLVTNNEKEAVAKALNALTKNKEIKFENGF